MPGNKYWRRIEFFIASERMNHHARCGSRRPILQLLDSCNSWRAFLMSPNPMRIETGIG